MAYFSNGIQYEIYRENICSKCLHDSNCPIMVAHYIYQDTEKEEILDLFIGRNETGDNEKCTMFIEKK